MNRHPTKCIAVLLVTSLVFSSCATVFNDTNPSVGITSVPSGADVYVDGGYVGETPTRTNMEVNRQHTVVVQKEGYRQATYTVGNHVGALWIILDVVFGLLWLIIDASTGDWHELDEENIHVPLVEEGQ